MIHDETDGAAVLAEHLAVCKQVDGVVAMQDGDATEVVLRFLAEGWTLVETEHVAGKRIRYLRAPEEEP